MMVVFGFAMALPEAVYANGVVKSGFVFQVNQAVFDAPEFDLSSRLTGEEPISAPDTVFQDEAPVTVSGITGSVAYKLKTASTKLVLGGDTPLVSEDITAHLLIRQVSVDAVIERVVSGIVLRVHFQGMCENIPLVLPTGKGKVTATVRSGIGADGLPTVAVPGFQIDWAPDSWVIGDFNCTGFDGFKDKVQAGLRSTLRDSSKLGSGLQNAVQSKIVELQAQLQAWFLTPRPMDTGFAGIKFTLFPKSIANLTASGFQLQGDLAFEFPSAVVNESVDAGPVGATSGVLSDYALVVPDALLTQLNLMSYKTGSYLLRKKGQDVAAFKSFQSNGLAQMFVWPEISRFSSTDPFYFDLSAQSLPKLSAIKDNGKGELNGSLSGDIAVMTWSPKSKTEFEKMVNFTTPFSGAYRMWIPAGGTELKVSFTNQATQLKAVWDPAYLKRNNPNTYIAADTIESEIQTYLKDTGLSFSLGAISMSSKLSVRPTSLSKQPSGILIQFK